MFIANGNSGSRSFVLVYVINIISAAPTFKECKAIESDLRKNLDMVLYRRKMCNIFLVQYEYCANKKYENLVHIATGINREKLSMNHLILPDFYHAAMKRIRKK